jgi:hypothetical protein
MSGVAMIPKAPGQREGPPSAAEAPGVQSRIKDASLSHLVKMACLAGSKLAVRVASGENVGFLYIRGGSVVHAVTRISTGETAAIEILRWSGGTFKPSEREWSAEDTISCSAQTLLLRATEVRAEKEGSNVVARGDGSDWSGIRHMTPAPTEESVELAATPLHVAGHTLRREDYPLFLRMSRDGIVVESYGVTPGFADVAAYALRLSQLVGDELGLERLTSMEWTSKQGRCFIVLESDGNVVALEPHPGADTSSLRERLGL